MRQVDSLIPKPENDSALAADEGGAVPASDAPETSERAAATPEREEEPPTSAAVVDAVSSADAAPTGSGADQPASETGPRRPAGGLAGLDRRVQAILVALAAGFVCAVVAVVVLAILLTERGSAPASVLSDAPGTTALAVTSPPSAAPTTASPQSWRLRGQFPAQFVDVPASTIDELASALCAKLRANNLDAVISSAKDSLRMPQDEATTLVYAVGDAYCPDVPLPAVTTVPPPPPVPTIAPGTWLVGADIQPGTYETTTTSTDILRSCYWARLSGTSGDFHEILANGNVNGHGIVTIKPTDVAFETRCIWTKKG